VVGGFERTQRSKRTKPRRKRTESTPLMKEPYPQS